MIYVWFMDNFIINYIIEIIDYKRFVMIVTADRKYLLLIRMISIKDEVQEPYHLTLHFIVCKFISTVQIAYVLLEWYIAKDFRVKGGKDAVG